MKTNDIVDIFVAYTEKKGGKTRPVLVIKLTNERAWLLKITSQYLRKSEQIRKYYYPIFNWKEYGLTKESFIDTKSYLVTKLTDMKISKVRGHFSLKDLKGLKKFIDNNEK